MDFFKCNTKMSGRQMCWIPKVMQARMADLINEKDTGDDISFALFPPLCNLGVDLLPHLGPYLTSVPRKQRQEPLRRQCF